MNEKRGLTGGSHLNKESASEKIDFQESEALDKNKEQIEVSEAPDAFELYEKFLGEQEQLFGLLSHENKLYKDLRAVLDKVLVAFNKDKEDFLFDCILKNEEDALIFQQNNHIFLSIGILNILGDDTSISLDKVAAIFAHEVMHKKYNPRDLDRRSDNMDELEKKSYNYIMTREAERQSDIESLELVNSSGFNPRAVIEVIESINKEEHNEDYFEYAFAGVWGMAYDPHETAQRRVRYLQNHFEQHLFSNRDKSQRKIEKDSIDLSHENYGFLCLLQKGEVGKALSAVSLPWHLLYITNFIKDKKLDNIYQDRINELKDTVFLQGLPEFSDNEKQILWDVASSPSLDYTIEQTLKISEDGDTDLEKVLLSLTSLFPEGNLVYEQSLEPGISKTDELAFSPIEKLMPIILLQLDEEIIDAMLSEWTEKNPEWLLNFLQNLNRIANYFTGEAGIIGDPIIQESMENNVELFLEHLARSEKLYNFSDQHLIEIFKCFSNERYNLAQDDVKEFCLLYLVNEEVGSDFHNYLEQKYKFLQNLDAIYGWSAHVNSRYNFLIHITANFEPHRRAILLGIYEWASEILLEPDGDVLNWEVVLEHVEGSAKTLAGHKKDEGSMGEYRSTFGGSSAESFEQLTPGQFWNAVMVEVSSIGTDEEITRKILSFDIPPEETVTLTAHTRLLDLFHTAEGEKAERISDLIRLQEGIDKLMSIDTDDRKVVGHNDTIKNVEEIQKAIQELPEISERNVVVLYAIDIAQPENKLAHYEMLSPLIVEESQEQVRADINQQIEDKRFFQKLIPEILKAGFSGAYKKHMLGFTNYTAELAAELVWQEKKNQNSFTSLSFDDRLRCINSFFPDVSLKRQELIVEETKPQNIKEFKACLAEVDLPMLRYKIGEQMWELISRDIDDNNVDAKISTLCECFPEASSYRDEHIIKTLHLGSVSYNKAMEIHKLMFSYDDLQKTETNELYNLMLSRVISQTIYFSHKDVKTKILGQIMDQVETDNVMKNYLPTKEKKELLSSFFDGPQSVFDDPYFRITMEGFFLKQSFSDDVVEKLIAIEHIDQGMIKSREEDEHKYEQETKAGGDITDLVDPKIAYERINSLSLDKIEKLYNQNIIYFDIFPELQAHYESLSEDSEPSSVSKVSNIEDSILGRITRSIYRKKIYETLSPTVHDEFPITQRLFFEIMDTLPKEKQAKSIAQFLSNLFESPEQAPSDVMVSYLESLGTVYIKAGQYMASLGHFNEEMQLKLLKLTSRVEPVDVFHIWHTIKEVYGERFTEIKDIGPLIGVASIRQVHKCTLQNEEERIIKIKRPESVHSVQEQVSSFSAFVDKTRTDSTLLGGVVLPRNLVKQVKTIVEKEVLSADDQDEQEWFHEHYEGKRLARKKLYIPTIDKKLSTPIITIESKAPGEPLDRHIEDLDSQTKKALLVFFLNMIFEEGKYHADAHPGNILEDDKNISLVDFGMVGNLSKINKFFFFKLMEDLYKNNADEFIQTIITLHIKEEGLLDELDPSVVKQEIYSFFEGQADKSGDFKDAVLQLLNTLESIKIALPEELKVLVKTISQLGYLIDGQEKEVQRWLGSKVLKSTFFTRKPKGTKDIFETAERYITEHISQESEREIKILKGTLIKSLRRKKIQELQQDIEINLDEVDQNKPYMLPLNDDTRVGIIPGVQDYQIQRGGRWIDLKDIIFEKK